MMEPTRRGFIQGLGALLAGIAVEPVAEILVPRRKIWVVGANFRPAARPGWMAPKLITEYIQTKAGREKLALSMIQPLRRQLQYSKIARGAFSVEILNQWPPEPRA